MNVHENLTVTMTIYNYPLAMVGVGLSIGVGIALWAFLRSYWWGRAMKKEREDAVKVKFIDGATDFIEDMVIEGEISRDEATMLYLNLKKCFPLRDLYPSVELLKANIRKRMNAFTHEPVELPDRIEPTVEKPRNMFSK